MRNRLGNICMMMGAVLVLAALTLFFRNQREAQRAQEAAEEILPQVIESIRNPQEQPTGYPDPYNPVMTEKTIDGYSYIGYLSIPSLELELPVMAQWDYQRLRIAPCRYTGSTKTDNLVIAAHNYARHFGNLSKLTAGEKISFVDMDGIVTVYEVAMVEIMEPTAIEEMTDGSYDLSLFTCTYGGKYRVTVRCDKSK